MADQYAFLDGKFYLVEETADRAVGVTHQEVSPEQAAPSLIADWLDGKLRAVTSLDRGTKSESTQVSDADFADGVIARVFDYVMDQNASFGEKQTMLRDILGDRPEVIRLFAEQFDPSWAEKIWDVKFVDALDPRAPPETPIKAPANVIVDAMRTQGTGPVSGGNSTTGREGMTRAPGRGSARGTGSSQGGAGGGKDPKTAGDPVILFSGQLALDVTDLEVPGRGLHFRFSRAYRHRTAYRGPLGYGWDHTWNLWLREATETEPGGRTVNVVYRSTGRMSADRYLQSDEAGLIADGTNPIDAVADASFAAPAGCFDELIKSGGVYRLVMATGVTVYYRGDTLQAERITDLNGNAVQIEYDVDDRLSRVTDPVGKRFNFTHDSLGHLVDVSDSSGGRRLHFDYDSAGDLISAELIGDDGSIIETDYRYLGPDYPVELQHALVSVINQAGAELLEVEYGLDAAEGAFGRVVGQRAEDGEWRYAYGIVPDPSAAGIDPDEDPLNYPWALTVVTTPRGEDVEHWCSALGNVVFRLERAEVDGQPMVLSTHWLYNDDGLVRVEQAPDGRITETTYGREVYIDAGGDPVAATAGERRRFVERRRVVQRPAPGRGVDRTIVEEFDFGEWQRPVAHRGPFWGRANGTPLGGPPSETRYRYDTRWNLVEILHADTVDADGMAVPGPRHSCQWTAAGLLREASLGGLATRYEYFLDVLRSAYIKTVIRDPVDLARRTAYEVDAVGRVLAMEGEYGAREEYRYDGVGRRIEATIRAPGLSAGQTQWTYDRAGRLVHRIERPGVPPGTLPSSPVVHRWMHDGFGRVVRESAGDGVAASTQIFVYGPDGEIDKVIDPMGVSTRIGRDLGGRVRHVELASGTEAACTREFRWTVDGQLAGVIDSQGRRAHFEYDAFGRRCVRVDREGTRVEQTLDAAGQPVRELVTAPVAGGGRARWAEREWAYDALGRLIVERVHVFDAPADTTDHVVTTKFYFDAGGRCTRTARDGETAQMTWDGLGRATVLLDADGVETRSLFDDAARLLTRETSAQSVAPMAVRLGRREQFAFDPFGRITAVTDGAGNVRTTRYDSAGRTVASAEPSGAAEEYLFDARGMTTRIDTVAAGVRTSVQIERDGRGDPTQFAYSSGLAVTIERDPLGRPVHIADGARTVEHAWNGEGFITERREPGGVVVRYSYTPEGRLAALDADLSGATGMMTSRSPVPRTAFTWTPVGALASADDGRHALTFDYDSLGHLRVEAVEGTLGPWTLSGRLNPAGALNMLTYSDGRTVTYRRSAAGRTLGCDLTADGAAGFGGIAAPAPLIRIVRAGNHVVEASTDATTVSLDYDAALRPVQAAWRSRSGQVLRDERRVYGARAECRLQQTDGELRQHTHDDQTRLDGWQEFPRSGALALGPVTARDANGFALGDQATSDAVRALPVPAVQRVVEFALDADGARLRRTDTARVAEDYVHDTGGRFASVGGRACVYAPDGALVALGADRFEFDALQRLVGVVRNGQRADITRDPLGRVLAIDDGSGTQVLRRFGSNVQERAVGGALQEQFLWVDERMWMATETGLDATVINALDGSPVARVSAAGLVSESRDRDPFGASNVREPLTLAGFRGVPGVQGIWLMGPRAYDPTLGSFLQPDPWWPFGDSHPYLYARHSPVRLQDDWGLATGDIDWGIVARSAAVPLLTGIAAGLLIGFLIGAGLVTAPFVLLAGGIMLAGMAFLSYMRRATEALDAGMTDYQSQAVLAAAGDIVGATDLYEGIRGRSALGDATLTTQIRSEKLGSGGGTMAGFLVGGRAFSSGKSMGQQFAAAQAAKRVAALPQPGPHDLDWSSLIPPDSSPPAPLRSAAAAAHEAVTSGLTDLNAGRVGMQNHNRATVVRTELGVTGAQAESAHIFPQTAGADLAGYRPGRALTVLLPPGTHTAFDQGWVQVWNQSVAHNQTITAAEVYSMVSRALDNVPTNLLTPAAKNTLAWRLHVEIFSELGLSPSTPVR